MKLNQILFIVAGAILLTACGGGLVRGEPPMIGLSSITVQSQTFSAKVDIYNPNGIDMPVDTVEMAMTLGDSDLGTHSEQTGLSIHPNGTEEIIFSFPASESASATLSELESKEINSVPYELTGRVIATDGDSEEFAQEGYLYPIPGRPGQFRGAGPQSDVNR